MAAAREIHSTFSVSSGCLCFGALHNIWAGASVPVRGFPIVRPRPSGTVNAHQLDFNVSAQNGDWYAYQLVSIEKKTVCGWFVAHSDVDPDGEIDKLLRVSGSPYEPDCGSTMNDDKTRAEGVFVINRYDWGFYDLKFHNEPRTSAAEGETDPLAEGNSAGLVDYAQAKSQIKEWKIQRASERRSSKNGIWMYIPHGEYMFGRFGFDDARSGARSFLFFNINTQFTRTTFAGLQQPLRKEESHEERFERRLREGHDFSGLEELRETSKPLEDPTMLSLFPLSPPETEWLGPYNESDHILSAQDLDHLRLSRKDFSPQAEEMLRSLGADTDALRRNRKLAPFVDPWKDTVYGLLNELALSYLGHFVLPQAINATSSQVGEALFPTHADSATQKKMDYYLHSCFMHPHANSIPNFDANIVEERIANFLKSHSGSIPLVFDNDCIAGICRVVAYLVSEVLDLSSNCAIDSYRNGIVPCDIRMAIHGDPKLFDKFKYSTVFWKGT
ncbi:hypothetical protein BKA66DRAFT_533653 [Pyrenochaeta sp. MPI-SDFR-AT-0127]|nr:hypothetical protein BKA66DRAFT_533653 [Pyrenochaeta sp. MPI-SDFR-AT-0127]